MATDQSTQAEVALVSTRRSGELRDWSSYRRSLRAGGVSLIDIDFFHRASDVFWPAVDALGAVIRRWRPSLVHVHSGVPACACAVLRDRRVWTGPTVAHLNSWNPRRPRWMDDMDAWGLARADRVITTSEAYRRKLLDLGVPARRLHLVRWGVDVPDLERQPARTPLIGLLGRVEPRKGQMRLVRSLPMLVKVWPDLVAEFVGPVADQDYAAAVRSEVRRLALGDRVRWRGEVAAPERLVARWHACVSASADEGQGLAVLEAMASGVPVVAVPAPGIEDFLVDGVTGRLARGSHASPLAAAIAGLLRDQRAAGRLAARARRMVVGRFGWDRTLSAISRVYRRAISDRRARP